MVQNKKVREFFCWDTFRRFTSITVLAVSLVSCLEESQSESSGRVPLRIPHPEPRSADVLLNVKHKIIESSLALSARTSANGKGISPRAILSRSLIKGIIAAQGLPRSQIKGILDELLSPAVTVCGGASCSRIFGLKASETDRYLDDLYLRVKKSKTRRDAEHANEYGWLVGSLKKVEQTAWNRPTVDGVSYLPNGDIDLTEGVGAFMDLPLEKGTRNLDVGGGAHDSNTKYLASRGVINYVYDPYARSDGHNRDVLRIVGDAPVDSVTSMSILNVIDDSSARVSHIELCKKSLKPGGKAYFKVWAGNGSGKGEYILGGYQSNRDAKSYIQEVKRVFGDNRVIYDDGLKALVAFKR